MDDDIIDRMRREEAELVRKLEAVRALLRAYGGASDSIVVSGAAQAEIRKTPSQQAPRSKASAREKMPLERFSPYGQLVVKAAIDECRSHLGRPIPSRHMVDLVEKRGIEVQGKDKANAISAMLARSIDLMPNGRKGWTLANPDDFDELLLSREVQTEEEPHSASAGGSSAEKGDAPTSPFQKFDL